LRGADVFAPRSLLNSVVRGQAAHAGGFVQR
jgi:hypothetical protein